MWPVMRPLGPLGAGRRHFLTYFLQICMICISLHSCTTTRDLGLAKCEAGSREATEQGLDTALGSTVLCGFTQPFLRGCWGVWEKQRPGPGESPCMEASCVL